MKKMLLGIIVGLLTIPAWADDQFCYDKTVKYIKVISTGDIVIGTSRGGDRIIPKETDPLKVQQMMTLLILAFKDSSYHIASLINESISCDQNKPLTPIQGIIISHG